MKLRRTPNLSGASNQRFDLAKGDAVKKLFQQHNKVC